VQSALRGGAGSDGLMQRFQVTVWPDDPPNKGVVDAEPNVKALTKAEQVFLRLADLDGRSVADPSCKMEEKIPWVRFDRDAQKRFIRWLDDHAKRCKRDGIPEAIESHLDKYKKLVPAVALVLELCDGCEKRSVGVASLDRAIRWAQYLESHAMRLYAFAASPERVFAPLLLGRLLQWKPDVPIRVRSIRQKGWTGLEEPKVIESTLDTLEDERWVQSVENVKTRSGGRPTTSYVLHPEAERWMRILKCHTTETNKTGAEVGSG
jgi:predicted transcriptional regulator